MQNRISTLLQFNLQKLIYFPEPGFSSWILFKFSSLAIPLRSQTHKFKTCVHWSSLLLFIPCKITLWILFTVFADSLNSCSFFPITRVPILGPDKLTIRLFQYLLTSLLAYISPLLKLMETNTFKIHFFPIVLYFLKNKTPNL